LSDTTTHFLLIGETNVARRVTAWLTERGHAVESLVCPADDELRHAVARRPRGIAILTHDDVKALRYALAAAHSEDDIPLVVSVFDRTVADQLSLLLPHCQVTSPAELAAPALAAACLDTEEADMLLAVSRQAGHVDAVVRPQGHPPRRQCYRLVPRQPLRVAIRRISGLARTPDDGTRMLLVGMSGLLTVLTVDWLWLVLGPGHSFAQALLEAVRVITTVGPIDSAGGSAHAVAASIAMLATVVFTALFTAGVVDRILGPRLAALVGPRVLPRSGHVVVVGLGQVGLRLCRELMALRIPVVGVERDPNAENLRLAHALKVPTVIGHGGDRELLNRVGARRARAIAAVGSDDLDNIAVAIAAQRISPKTRVVLRAGEHEDIAETRSLLRLCEVCDVSSLSAVFVVETLLGCQPVSVVACDTILWVEAHRGQFAPFSGTTDSHSVPPRISSRNASAIWRRPNIFHSTTTHPMEGTCPR
jgi:TrkA-N domain